MTAPPRSSRRSREELEPALQALIAAALAEDGQPPFNEANLLEQRDVVALELGGELVGAAMTGPETEFVIHPRHRGRGYGGRMLEAILTDDFAAWAHGDHPAARALAARYGMRRARVLLQLRAPVPVQRAPWRRDDAVVDLFRAGADDAEWVALNARIFATHPEQGAITVDGLRQRVRENGAEDFLVARGPDGRMLGYCWLKLAHGLGEVYVLGVAPERAGTGLGGALLDAGLARLAERGVTESNLYVESDNEAALRLYRARGYRDHTIDVLYRSAPPRS